MEMALRFERRLMRVRFLSGVLMMNYMNLGHEGDTILAFLCKRIPGSPTLGQCFTMSGFEICQNFGYPVSKVQEAVETLRFVALVEEHKFTNYFRPTGLGRMYFDKYLAKTFEDSFEMDE